MLFAVMIIIGTVTLALVFNLDHVARSTYGYYDGLKRKAIKPMKKDTDTWKDLAKKYESFEPLPADTKPSEWWVVWYIILWPFKAIIGKVALTRKPLGWFQHQPPQAPNLVAPAVDNRPAAGNEDWMKDFPAALNEAEISISPVQAPPTDEIVATPPPEKSTTLIESGSTEAEIGNAGVKKYSSRWHLFRGVFTESTQKKRDGDGEGV
jgi:hypothetical protein